MTKVQPDDIFTELSQGGSTVLVPNPRAIVVKAALLAQTKTADDSFVCLSVAP